MAASVSGMFKTYLEGLNGSLFQPTYGVSLTVDRNRANMSRSRPYVVVYEDLDLARHRSGDAGKNPLGSELVQIDLWQDETAEVAGLADGLSNALNGAVLNFGTPVKQVFGCFERGRTRSVDVAAVGKGPKVNVVHHAYTLDIHRQI